MKSKWYCVAFALIPYYSLGHSGGTDQYGCHTNSSTGVYHCHNSGSSGSSESEPDDGDNGPLVAEVLHIYNVASAAGFLYYGASSLSSGHGEYKSLGTASLFGLGFGMAAPFSEAIDGYMLSRIMDVDRSSMNFGLSASFSDYTVRGGVGYLVDISGVEVSDAGGINETIEYFDITYDLGLLYEINQKVRVGVSYDFSDESVWIDANYSP